MKPNLNKKIQTTLKWSDEFNSDLSLWYQDTLENDALHRTGNKHISIEGLIDMDLQWQTVPGRWAALYNKHRNQCQFIRDEKLVMKGFAVKESNYYRENFLDDDMIEHKYGDYMLYAPWLSTWGRVWNEKLKRHITDVTKTSLTVTKGTVVEARVNFEKMNTRGFRWSFWLMPATDATGRIVADLSYDASTENGVEIDAPEIENPEATNSDYGHCALMKFVAGEAGDTPNALKDFRDFGIDLRKGWHTFTTVWLSAGNFEFYCDGKLINKDDRCVDVSMYLVMSREMNSGVKKSDNPRVPADPGLTGQSVILDVDKIENDEVLVDYVRVWDIVENSEDTVNKSIVYFNKELRFVENNIAQIENSLHDLSKEYRKLHKLVLTLRAENK